jgi:hypothetical protein
MHAALQYIWRFRWHTMLVGLVCAICWLVALPVSHSPETPPLNLTVVEPKRESLRGQLSSDTVTRPTESEVTDTLSDIPEVVVTQPLAEDRQVQAIPLWRCPPETAAVEVSSVRGQPPDPGCQGLTQLEKATDTH